MAADIKEVLAHSPVFQELSAEALAAIVMKGTLRRLQRRGLLFHQGDAAEEFAVVLEGRLKLTQVSAEGQDLIVRYVGPGEMCAVVALFAGQEYPAAAEAVGDTTVIAWPRNTLDELLRGHPQLALNVLRILTERMGGLSTTPRARHRKGCPARCPCPAAARWQGGTAHRSRRRDRHAADPRGHRQAHRHHAVHGQPTDGRLGGGGTVESGRERVVIRCPHDLVVIAEDLPAE